MTELLLAFVMLLLALPSLSLLILTIAALGQNRKPIPSAAASAQPVRVAVLVPAHNESVNVLPTIACLLKQLKPNDQLLVVADNCSDDTAALALAAGAQVLERHHAGLRGKGYALAFGVDALRADPPDVVLVVDADCVVSEGAVACIAQHCRATDKPVQMLNLMSAWQGAGLKIRVLEFAQVMKNLVRPLGSFRLGGACPLMGTGMALPWALIVNAKLATGHITEDLKLGLDLVVAGHATQFLPQVRVSSAFPMDTGGAKTQKSRWEHGSLAILMEELPGVLWAALKTGKPALLVTAMDLLIPPVALYFLVLAAALGLSLGAAMVWPVWQLAAVVASLAAVAFFAAIALTWWSFGRHLLSAKELLSTPVYALWKLPVYLAFFLKKRSDWVRTKRVTE